MRTKIISVLVVIGGVVGLAGCKPKVTTVAAQVFIVMQGGNNIKLGDIEILLIEKPKATEFVQKKKAVVEAMMESRRQEMVNAEKAVEKSRNDHAAFLAIRQSRPDLYEPPQAGPVSVLDSGRLRFTKYALFNYKTFFTNTFFTTNADCIKLKKQIDLLWRQQQALAKPIDTVEGQLRSSTDENEIIALSRRDDALRVEWNEKTEDIDSLLFKLETVLDGKIAEKKADVDSAEIYLGFAKKVWEDSPTADDFLNGFSPGFVQKAVSDADGRFSFTYPRDRPLAIYASAQRTVSAITQKYYWLVDAPTNAENIQLILSNNNLVSADPNNYFELKPK